MLFQRRLPLSFSQKLQNFIWPHMGWKRTLRYYKLRTLRIPDSVDKVAAGLAIGCATSFIPLFGLHLVQTTFFCWALRVNILAGMIGSLIGNIFTYPFFWLISGWAGFHLFDVLGIPVIQVIDSPISTNEIENMPYRAILPILCGGIVMTLLSYPLFFYPIKALLQAAKTIRHADDINDQNKGTP